MNLIDSHCHLDDPDFDADRSEVVARCKGLGINGIVLPAVTAAGWPRLLDVAASDSIFFPTLGLHPVYIAEHREEHLARLEAAIEKYRPIAVGEIGLDHYVPELDRERQMTFFEAQLAIAAAAGLPVVLHVRKAHDQVLACLRRSRVTGGICHAFNGSLQQARQYLELGFKLGFGGTLTYERARRIHRLARELPLEAMVLETDAPDMPPAAHRGERNSPEYLPQILEALSRLRDESPQTIAGQATANVRQVLRLV